MRQSLKHRTTKIHCYIDIIASTSCSRSKGFQQCLVICSLTTMITCTHIRPYIREIMCKPLSLDLMQKKINPHSVLSTPPLHTGITIYTSSVTVDSGHFTPLRHNFIPIYSVKMHAPSLACTRRLCVPTMLQHF